MFRYVLHGWGVGGLWNVSGDSGMLREVVECYGGLSNVTVKTRSTRTDWNVSVCFTWVGGREIVECFGRLWNVTVKTRGT